MYFELAELFGCPVSEMLERISSKELTEWLVYFKVKSADAKKEGDQAELLNKLKAKTRGRYL